jgi:hypothetical protein
MFEHDEIDWDYDPDVYGHDPGLVDMAALRCEYRRWRLGTLPSARRRPMPRRSRGRRAARARGRARAPARPRSDDEPHLARLERASRRGGAR